jgi:hypothetical protein
MIDSRQQKRGSIGGGETGVARLAFDRYERKTHQEERSEEWTGTVAGLETGEGSVREGEVSNPFVHPFKVVMLSVDDSFAPPDVSTLPLSAWSASSVMTRSMTELYPALHWYWQPDG